MSKKWVESTGGRSFEVDTSDKACAEFGFKHGDFVRIPETGPLGPSGIVEGVAPLPDSGKNVLWCAFEDGFGRVSYLDKPA